MCELERHNPIKLIKQFWPEANVDHVTSDTEMHQGDYDIVRGSTHDGTLLFTWENLQKVLLPIANMTTARKGDEPDTTRQLNAINYRVGPLRVARIFGRFKLPCSETHKYPAQKERMRMSVKVEFVYQEEKL